MKQILIKVDEEVHKDIKVQSAYNDVTMNEFVNIALEHYFDFIEEEHGKVS